MLAMGLLLCTPASCTISSNATDAFNSAVAHYKSKDYAASLAALEQAEQIEGSKSCELWGARLRILEAGHAPWSEVFAASRKEIALCPTNGAAVSRGFDLLHRPPGTQTSHKQIRIHPDDTVDRLLPPRVARPSVSLALGAYEALLTPDRYGVPSAVFHCGMAAVKFATAQDKDDTAGYWDAATQFQVSPKPAPIVFLGLQTEVE